MGTGTGLTKFGWWLGITGSVLAATVGVLTEVAEFAHESNAASFSLVFVGLLGMLCAAPKRSAGLGGQIYCFTIIVAMIGFLWYSWTQGGLQALGENGRL